VSSAPQKQRQAFADAIHALASEPTPANVVRYLVASRNLDQPSHPDVSERPKVAVAN
jgi:hypothetical protein